MRSPLKGDKTCPNCDTLHIGLPVEGDEDGAYVYLETTDCPNPSCKVRLCSCCPQFQCDGCQGHFCLNHRNLVPDGTLRPLELCNPCKAGSDENEAPAPHIPHNRAQGGTLPEPQPEVA